jgi:hypothetical protein
MAFAVNKCSRNIWANSAIFDNLLRFINSPLVEISPILITLGSMLWSQFSAIFDNFRRTKLAFFSKTNVMIKILHNLALFWVKNANFFCWNFRRKYLKNHNIGPWPDSMSQPLCSQRRRHHYVCRHRIAKARTRPIVCGKTLLSKIRRA